jgi:beta-glucanase (GH16 family)
VRAERLEPPGLVWSDEFDGAAGTPPEPRVWTHELGDGTDYGIPGWGNAELQVYTDSTANAALDGRGNLAITASRSGDGYASARLVTKGKLEVEHGRIEACVRVPRGGGLWPAVWALGTDIDERPWPACGEIDVMEHVCREPRRIFGTIHGPGYSGDGGHGAARDLPYDVADAFHVFAVDWEPELLVWSLDGEPYHRATPADVPGPWVFDHPFYLLLNLAVGGTFGGRVAEDTAFPQAFLVDYVRVYAAP